MLVSLNDISNYSVEATDISPSVEDIWLDREQLSAYAVTLDIGGWFSEKFATVSSNRISDIDPDGRSFTVDLSKSDVEAGIDMTPDGSYSEPSALSAFEFSKPLLSKGKEAVSDFLLGKHTAEKAGLPQLVRLSDILSAEVFGQDGEIGKTIDLLVDPEGLCITHIVIDTGKILAERQVVVPINMLSHFAAEGTHTVLNTTRAKVENSPPLEEFDAQDRNWIDKVASYYGLSGTI